MCALFGNKPHNRWLSPLSYPSRQRTLAVNWSPVFSRHFASLGKGPGHYDVHGKTVFSQRGDSDTFFSPHGNAFRILRSGDRLEHTQIHIHDIYTSDCPECDPFVHGVPPSHSCLITSCLSVVCKLLSVPYCIRSICVFTVYYCIFCWAIFSLLLCQLHLQ